MKKTILIITSLFVFAVGSVSAQYNETNNLFYFSQRSPEANQLNPAFFPSNNAFYLKLPTVGFQFGFPLALSDMIYYDEASDKNIISFDRMLNTLNNSSQFRLGVDANILGFGFRIHNLFLDFNTQLRFNFNLGLPVDLLNFLTTGNVDNNNEVISEITLIDGDFFNTQAYLETSLGAGYKLPILPLTIGAHVKLLSGLFNMQMDNTKITFNTSQEFDTVSAHMYYELMAASFAEMDTTGGPLAIPGNMINNLVAHPMDAVKALFDMGGNTGIAFDIGAKYDLGPFTFSASINDLTAGIHWQRNILGFVPEGGMVPIDFGGLDMNELLDNGTFNLDTLSNYISSQLDKMKMQVTEDATDYWYSIPTKLNVAATANLGILKAGVLFHGQWDRGLISKKNAFELDLGDNVKNTFRFNTTISAGLNLFNWAELILATSIVSDGNKISPLNPGLGFIFTPATILQTYFMLDYASSIYLAEMKAFNVKFGFNILIGGGGRRKVLGF